MPGDRLTSPEAAKVTTVRDAGKDGKKVAIAFLKGLRLSWLVPGGRPERKEWIVKVLTAFAAVPNLSLNRLRLS